MEFDMTVAGGVRSRSYDGAERGAAGANNAYKLASLLTMSTVAATMMTPAQAQPANDSMQLDTVEVLGNGEGVPENINNYVVPLSRLPTTVQDTPQTVNVISRERMEERQTRTLTEVLRQTPGITINAGEGGGGGQPGDNFNIRGFMANGDIFVDGMQDLGIYNRDTFNLESVQVYKGPSGTTFGRGSGGGSINLTTKTPKMRDFGEIEGTVGTSNYYRSTLDVNRIIGEGMAVRFNALGLNRKFAERDHADQGRWAVAPSLAFGLGTDTRLYLDYLHQREDNVPDTGVPYFQRLPVTEFGVARSNWYGYRDNYEKINADVATARFEKDFGASVKLTNTTRVLKNELDRVYSVMPTNLNTACTNPANWASCNILPVQYRRGMDVKALQNSTVLGVDFSTGALTHEARVGVDIALEEHTQRNYTTTALAGGQTALNLLNPAYALSNTIYAPSAANARTETSISSTAVSLYDRIGLGNGFYVIGSGRYERYDANARVRRADGTAASNDARELGLWTWNAALQYKPVATQTYYISAGSSMLPLYDPKVEYSTSVSAMDYDPEKIQSYEAGAKLDFLNGRLGTNFSVFQIERTNMRVNEPGTGAIVLEGKRRIRGAEIQVEGNITDAWTIAAGYTYLDGRIIDPRSNPFGHDTRMMRVPEHALSLWSTYKVTERFTVGAGVTYLSDRLSGEQGTTKPSADPATWAAGAAPNYVPSQYQVDAMLSYKVTDNFTLRFNALNLTNALTYDGVHAARQALPGVGRTFLLSGKATF